MAGKSNSPLAPVHPGELLREETMPGHNWEVKTLANILSVEESKINDLINERIPVDQDISERLGKVLDIDKCFWFRFQKNYEMRILENDIKSKMIDSGSPITLDELNKQKIILSALSATKPNSKVGSVHAQRIMFKIDKEVCKSNSWIPNFEFVPYKHGPFDPELNSILNRLAEEGFVDIAFPSGTLEWRNRKYVLTAKGRKIGENMLEKLPEYAQSRIIKIVDWAMSLGVTKLKSEICQQYPEYVPDKEQPSLNNS